MLRNSLANWAAYLVSALVSFFLSPFIVRHLGDTGYGVWVLMGSIVGYLGLLDLGVRGAIARFIAAHHAITDHRSASETVRAALKLFTGLSILALTVAAVLGLFVSRWFDVPPDLAATARLVIWLGGLAIAVSFIAGVFGGVIAGLQRFDLDSGLEIGVTAIRVILVIVTLQAGYGLIALALIQLAVIAVRGVIAYWLCRRLYPEISFDPRQSSGTAIGSLLQFSLFSSILQIAAQVIYYTDAVVIGTFLSLASVTFYAIAANLAEYGRQIAGAVARIVTPRVSGIEARQEITGVQQVVLSTARWTALLVMPIAATFVLRGSRFIGLWMGPEYGEPSGQVLAILAATVFFAGGYFVSVSAIMGINQHRGLAIPFGLQALFNLLFSLVLVRPLELVGVAISTAVPALALSLGYLPWYLRRTMGIPISRFAINAWLKPSLLCLPFILATLMVELLWIPGSLLGFFGQTFMLLLVLAITILLGGLETEERNRLVALTSRLRTA